MQVSKRYHQLKDRIESMETDYEKEMLRADKKIAQKLLNHWGMYYIKDDWLIAWFIEWLIDCLYDLLIVCMIDWLFWMIDWC